MDLLDQQLPAPKNWDKFEALMRALFAAVWENPLIQRHGRAGQVQHGVDVFGSPKDNPDRTYGVQCKGKDQLYGAAATADEFDTELAKAERFSPQLSQWVFATTAPNDGALQRHVAAVSERRVKAGQFPVSVQGWESIVGLLSSHPKVLEEFYPERSSAIQQLLGALAEKTAPAPDWTEISFTSSRDLGPALMGRPLGPADVDACPTLPEAETLLQELRQAGTARLAGVPGAGKSICALQAARAMRARGWRTFRLTDPTAGLPIAVWSPEPTLYIVDDAHLAPPAQLRALEESASATRWVLSTHTLLDEKLTAAGTIHLDAKRAVAVIARGLRAEPERTLVAVRKADDRVGPGWSEEPLDWRLDEAETALLPWQFCFILGGGWRRAKSMAGSARAAGADVVLAAAAIRQLASRDASCPLESLRAQVEGHITDAELLPAINWLVAQRLLLTRSDLRCPHQRLAGVLLDQILNGQNLEGVNRIAYLLQSTLTDPMFPLGGFAALLRELRSIGHNGSWSHLIKPEWMRSLLDRAWVARTPDEILHACWALNEVRSHLNSDEIANADHQNVIVGWIEGTPKGACYTLGRFMNQIMSHEKELGAAINARINPNVLAGAMNTADPVHACEIAELITLSHLTINESWKITYLAALDRDHLFRLVSNWPSDASLSLVAGLCEHISYVDESLACELIEALAPSIAGRLQTDPQGAFQELNDLFWHALRVYDPLQMYVGNRRPSAKRKRAARRICACWKPKHLAEKLSQSNQRSFQAAAGLLDVLRKVSPFIFAETVQALDWLRIEAAIGPGWQEDIGDARMLLSVAWQLPAARPAISELIARNEDHIIDLSPRLALMAPEVAFRHLIASKSISITKHGHCEWGLGVYLVARIARTRPSLLAALLEPHYVPLAAILSQQSPSFWDKASLFIRVLAEVDEVGLTRILDQIDPARASDGWRRALLGGESRRKRNEDADPREAAALLIHYAINRADALGDVARHLRRQYAKRSTPSAKMLEPIVWPESFDETPVA
ncbi:hypothetical protein GWL_29590 [Herbaspirillum sp. GW103]|uniref:hypothetical protein n=1 Tax=Herbaspirillum sp. GW103 TaxID=1175306 RepID=UPI00025E2EFD|nr:hypothetical protein [Herbaspirillum sp. GW103]EIJ45931.1 hypothetical protein GWL_29590 [Herbaspirillum sp. GW103]